jgi:hypothetical protein
MLRYPIDMDIAQLANLRSGHRIEHWCYWALILLSVFGILAEP